VSVSVSLPAIDSLMQSVLYGLFHIIIRS